MGTIYLIRHGETPWNQQARYQGQMDIELSDQGVQQAQYLAHRMRRCPLAAIYASDLQRAWQTAQIIAGHHGLAVHQDPRLRETNFGVWEGRTRDEIKQEYPELFRQRYSAAGQAMVPGAESPQTVQERMLLALNDAVRLHPQDAIAFVSHGGALRLVFCSILGVPLDQAYRIRMYNTSFSQLRVKIADHSLEWYIQCLNDTSHLRPQEVIGH